MCKEGLLWRRTQTVLTIYKLHFAELHCRQSVGTVFTRIVSLLFLPEHRITKEEGFTLLQ